MNDELGAAGEAVRKLKRGRTLLLSRDPAQRKAEMIRQGRALAAQAAWQKQCDAQNRWQA